MATTKFQFTPFGLAHDPRGAHVMLTLGDRTLLGDVTGCSRDEGTGCIRLTVRHFNGEPWPLQPAASEVDVLVRDDLLTPQDKERTTR